MQRINNCENPGTNFKSKIQHFDMPEVQLPVFPNKDFIITNYGAVGNGIHMNTEAISRAINDCSSSGGGRVVIPPGIWLTGPITLKSNVNLHVEKGALVLFTKDFSHYPIVMSHYEGLRTWRCLSPINGENLENIAITGEGIFDGQGEAWRPVKKVKMTEAQWEKLINSGGVLNEQGTIWWPTKEALEGERFFKANRGKVLSKEECEPYKVFMRPNLLSLVNCRKVLLDGPTFQNSPAWNLHPLLCEHVTIRNVTVRNPWYSQNGDGLDLESCRNAQIYNSAFDVGDDAICMKSGKDEEGRKRGRPTENVRIYGCTVYHGHGGFVVGSEMSGGVRNVYISDCTFIGTDTGIRFKSTRGRGGVVENIYIENILMKDIQREAIILTMHYSVGKAESSKEEENQVPPVTDETPEFRNISISNIVCINAERAVHIMGLPELPINNICFDNILITAEKGIECSDATYLKLNNIKLRVKEEYDLTFRNCSNVETLNVENIDGTEVKVRNC